MSLSKLRRNGARVLFSSGICAVATIGIVAHDADAAPERFDVNGAAAASGVTAAGSPFSWEAAGYSSTSAGTDPVPWVEGNFLRLCAGTDAGTSNYTIVANSNHTIAGMFLQSGGGGTVNINGPGVLSIASGIQGFLVNSSTQVLRINAQLSGSGGVTNTLSGSLFLLGNNDYSGGTEFGSVAGMNFNNNNSFGTGPMTWKVATQVLADDVATTPITLPNAMNTRAASTLIYVGPAAAPVTFSNSWTLAAGTSTLTIGNATHLSSKMTINGSIGGAGASLTSNGPATLVLGGSNSYDGTTTINQGTTTAMLGSSLGAAGGALVVNSTGTTTPTNTVLNLSSTEDTTKGSLSGTLTTPATDTATIKTNGRTLTINQTADGTYQGKITGAGGLTLGASSTATLTLTGTNDYTGGTTVNAGRLVVNRLHESNAVTVNGGKLQVADSSPTLPNFPSGQNSAVSRPTALAIANDGAALGIRVYNGTLDLGNNELPV